MNGPIVDIIDIDSDSISPEKNQQMQINHNRPTI